jgi:5-methylcytosine-specific restriction endonuclease McrA
MAAEAVAPPCELCGRTTQPLTGHHLIPRTLHGNKKVKEAFDRAILKKTAAVCRPCHDQMHALFTEKELGWQYNTVEKLKAHPEVRKWIEWVSKRPHWRG